MQDIKEVFSLFDKSKLHVSELEDDSDDEKRIEPYLELDEVKMALKALGFKVHKKEILSLMPHKNGTQQRPLFEQDCGYIEFDYFQEIMRHKYAKEGQDSEQKMLETFTMFADAKTGASHNHYTHCVEANVRGK